MLILNSSWVCRRECEDVKRGCEDVKCGYEDVKYGCEDVKRGCEDLKRGCEDVKRGCEDVKRGWEDVKCCYTSTYLKCIIQTIIQRKTWMPMYSLETNIPCVFFKRGVFKRTYSNSTLTVELMFTENSCFQKICKLVLTIKMRGSHKIYFTF